MNPYRIELAVLHDGERLPFLCRQSDGIPLFDPAAFVLSDLRGTGRTWRTIEQALRSIMVLQIVLDGLKVDINSRMLEFRFLEVSEIDQIVHCSRYFLDDLVLRFKDGDIALKPVSMTAWIPGKIGRKPKERLVDPNTVSIRLHYIHRYLKWCGREYALRIGAAHLKYQSFADTRDMAMASLFERIPSFQDKSQKRGLPEEVWQRVLKVIDSDSNENPWKGTHVKARNQLIILFLLKLGVRRGEAASIESTDISYREGTVWIKRLPDTVDPRREQAGVKTLERKLKMDEELLHLTRIYVTRIRNQIQGAKKHNLLFVANGSGAPLALTTFNAVFHQLRRLVPDLPDLLSPHIMRHTWNEEFSKEMDRKGVPEDREKKVRSSLMGWNPSSDSAAFYTKRHIEQKGREASLELQARLKKS